jgi:hypothetical protein
MGAVEVSRLGGLRHRSVFGEAASVKEPIHSGTASWGTLSAVKDELSGGIVASLWSSQWASCAVLDDLPSSSEDLVPSPRFATASQSCICSFGIAICPR